jgi:hypothetical protein
MKAGAMTTTSNPLEWEDACTEVLGDQNADTRLVDHGYWALGSESGRWSVALIEQSGDGYLSEVAYHLLGRSFLTEIEAKAAAQKCEQAGQLPSPCHACGAAEGDPHDGAAHDLASVITHDRDEAIKAGPRAQTASGCAGLCDHPEAKQQSDSSQAGEPRD